MFPSYKNKADREQKLKAYLAQVKLDNAVDQAKQQAYSHMIWSTDVESKLSTLLRPVATPQTLSKATNTEWPEGSIANSQPQTARVSASTQTKIRTKNFGAQFNEDAATDGLLQEKARQELVELFSKYPELIIARIHPISKQMILLKGVVIGRDGELYADSDPNIKAGGRDIDWVRTLNYVYETINERVSADKPLEMEELNTDHIDPKEKIIRLLNKYPQYDKKFHPFTVDGEELKKYDVNKDCKLEYKGKVIKSTKQDIDWEATYNHMQRALEIDNTFIKGDSFSSTDSTIDQFLNDTANIRARETMNDMLNKITSGETQGTAFPRESSTLAPLNIKDEPSIKSERLTGVGLRKRLVGGAPTGPRGSLIPYVGLRGGSTHGTVAHVDILKQDYLYRPLGSKFVGLKALTGGYLSLKHPSGSAVGRRIKLSDATLNMIRDLVFDGQFNHDAYNMLTTDEKKVVYDTMNATKLLHSFKNSITDPYDKETTYRYELDKLLGEIKLGNTNISNKNELKRLAMHMFQSGEVTEREFKSIIPLMI